MRDGLDDSEQVVASMLYFADQRFLDLFRVFPFEIVRCLSRQ